MCCDQCPGQTGSPHRQQWPRVLGPAPVSSSAPLPDHILVHCINQTKPGPRLANIGHLLLFGGGVPIMPPQSVSPFPRGPKWLQEAEWPCCVCGAATGPCLGHPWRGERSPVSRCRVECGHWPLENTDPVSCCPSQQTHCSTLDTTHLTRHSPLQLLQLLQLLRRQGDSEAVMEQ